MREAKFTPGKWYADVFGNVTAHEPRTGWRSLLPTRRKVATAHKGEFDAHLIAAAPDMYDALVRVEWQITRRGDLWVEACPLCDRTREQGHKTLGDTNGCTAGCDDGCFIGDALARVRGES